VAGAFPSTAILDTFNRANGAPGTNWRGQTGGYAVAANRLDVNSGGDVYWNVTRFGADQEAYVTLTTIDPNAAEIDLLLKSQSSTYWGSGLIEVLYDAVNRRVQVWTYATSQGWVQYGPDIPATFANGDRFGARATAAGVVTVYRNGAVIGTANVSAWPLNAGTGYIGLWLDGASNAVLDDFGGGNVVP
jgi:hypothetical protein